MHFLGSQNMSSITSVPIKEKSTLSVSKAQDSLMVVNNEISLQPSHSAERLKREAESEQKKSFLAAKAQDSLMVVNDQKPLQPAASAEQSNLETTSKSEESKTAQQKNN